MDQNEKESTQNSWWKRIWNIFWGDSPLPLLLKINAKLSRLDKTLNILWLITFLVSLIPAFTLVITNYVVIVTPLVALAIVSIIIVLRKGFGKQRFVQFLLSAVILAVSREWMDIPAYMNSNYKTVEGVPSKFVHHSTRHSNYWEVVVSNVEFHFRDIDENNSDKWLIIKYLPFSKFVLEYEALSKQELH